MSQSRTSAGLDARGLPICDAALSEATPINHRENVERFRMTPIRSIGIGTKSSLKASFWRTDLEDTEVAGDPDYAAVMVHLGGALVRRNAERIPGAIGSMSMQPFETTRWRLDGMVSFVHIFVPVALMGDVSESLFSRDFGAEHLAVPWATRDRQLFAAVSAVQSGLLAGEPTSLLLDSWALILSDLLVRRFSTHSGRPVRISKGRIPARGVALVVDYIEANIDKDLDLAELSSVASMSVYHFARRFKETVGISPHAYVRRRRVLRARSLLDRQVIGLAEVAAMCGFSSQAHLTTVFRSQLGVTPGQYKRMAG
ncbi:AraC family transcriptional regulator [Kaistia soli DSM 19436]|uniref:AraC family transcriptional regulator n=1 Tax=Kaistia soli DSM 19436 TaxID=1122133 RepID=A0A1M5IA70_9HYPH|nr:AraC family transcriptional regulator [Kaistia soli]SHG24969.1 AraC family transcriptional regulator [Kaistia soli DSM 19436]